MINLQPLSKEMQNFGIQKFCPFLALHFPCPHNVNDAFSNKTYQGRFQMQQNWELLMRLSAITVSCA